MCVVSGFDYLFYFSNMTANVLTTQADALKKMIGAVKLVNGWKNLYDRIAIAKESKSRSALEDEMATFLQNTLSRAKSRKMWKKYTEFYSKVFKSRWIFQMAIRTWRKKKAGCAGGSSGGPRSPNPRAHLS